MAKRRADDMPRLSDKEVLILELLVARERYGLQLVRDSGKKLKRGTVYVTLDRMEKKGLVTSREEDRAEGMSGIARRLYKITGVGQRPK